MSASTAFHAAIFGVGALVGAGVTAAVTYPRKTSVPPPQTSVGPVVDVDVKNKLRISNELSLVESPGAVLKYGHPGPVPDLLQRKAYVVAYDRRLRHPSWTAEHLTLASLGKSRVGEKDPDAPKGDRGNSAFKEDESIPAAFRARLSDYFRSGYDRGHMVPAADAKMSQEAMDETFLLTNIAPQVGVDFNRHYWAYLEDCFQDVYVFTVPLYLPKKDSDGKWRTSYEVIGSPVPNVSVPTHFAKVVLGARPSSPSTPTIQELSLGAFVLPNTPISDETPLTNFVVPVDSVERAAGLTLFSDAVKQSSRHICQTSKCEVIVRRFDDAQSLARSGSKKAIGPPN
ncbi:nuclease [Tulasnella sp. 403]|nr:nuclease [Tulasnella sp. 403]